MYMSDAILEACDVVRVASARRARVARWRADALFATNAHAQTNTLNLFNKIGLLILFSSKRVWLYCRYVCFLFNISSVVFVVACVTITVFLVLFRYIVI